MHGDEGNKECLWNISELHALNKITYLFGVLVNKSRNYKKGQNFYVTMFNSKKQSKRTLKGSA